MVDVVGVSWCTIQRLPQLWVFLSFYFSYVSYLSIYRIYQSIVSIVSIYLYIYIEREIFGISFCVMHTITALVACGVGVIKVMAYPETGDHHHHDLSQSVVVSRPKNDHHRPLHQQRYRQPSGKNTNNKNNKNNGSSSTSAKHHMVVLATGEYQASHVGRGHAGAIAHTIMAVDDLEIYVLHAKEKENVLEHLPDAAKVSFLDFIDATSLHAKITIDNHYDDENDHDDDTSNFTRSKDFLNDLNDLDRRRSTM